jgi:hypothetical protein
MKIFGAALLTLLPWHVVQVKSNVWCLGKEYDLVAGGGNPSGATYVGRVCIVELGSDLNVSFTMDGDELTSGDDRLEDNSETLLYLTHIAAGCSSDHIPQTKNNGPKPGRFAASLTYETGASSGYSMIPKPKDCGDCNVVVAFHAEVKKIGGVDFLNSALPAQVQYSVTTDHGSGAESSYFNTAFNTGPLADLVLDGYCLDIGHGISLNRLYNGWAVNAYDEESIEDLATHIDDPSRLSCVSWLINNYAPGDSIQADFRGGSIPPYCPRDFPNDLTKQDIEGYLTLFGDGTDEVKEPALTSGTIQRAIWYIIDDSQFNPSAHDDRLACYLAYLSLLSCDFVPGCDDLVPIVLVSDVDAQTTFAQTTFVSLNVPCESLEETAWATEDDGSTPLGNRFTESTWATYVNFPQVCPN